MKLSKQYKVTIHYVDGSKKELQVDDLKEASWSAFSDGDHVLFWEWTINN